MLARDWKIFYAQERDRLGPAGMERLIAHAPALEHPARGAIVFPHTKLTESGELIAAAAAAVVRCGRPRVLALGVLHGGLAADAELLQRARNGDAAALTSLRRIHGPGVPGDQGRWREEFSLDSFAALVHVAADVHGRKAPEIVARFPFLTGAEPASLPGIDALHRLISEGCAWVATTDPIHHGAGYGTPAPERRDPANQDTVAFARDRIARQFAALSTRNYAAFAERTAVDRSDFRDNGPVLRELLGAGETQSAIHELRLVNYADTFQAESPTWVAAVLATLVPGSA